MICFLFLNVRLPLLSVLGEDGIHVFAIRYFSTGPAVGWYCVVDYLMIIILNDYILLVQ